MRVVLWTITVAGAIFGALVLGSALLFAEDASERAAGGAVGAALAVIPYVIARGWDALGQPNPGDRKECPRCFETTDARASICRFCGSEFEAEPG